MCSRVQCEICDRPTYAGCGNHVEEVLGDVAPDERCQCRTGERRSTSSRFGWLTARARPRAT